MVNHSTITRVMGILNVTPDSFSDGGQFSDPAAAVAHAHQMLDEGADILDIGAESTRPSATYVAADDEWKRLAPVLCELACQVRVPISVDTYKSQVAAKAVQAGATWINDVWGGLRDPDILRVAADGECHYVWMHNREQPVGERFFEALLDETKQGIERCLGAGIREDRLWIDPGIGFGKTYGQNLVAMKRLREYCELGFPVLLGTSRKSVIGKTLGTQPDNRLAGSLATVSVGVMSGVKAVRVHDVSATVMTCKMVEAIDYASED